MVIFKKHLEIKFKKKNIFKRRRTFFLKRTFFFPNKKLFSSQKISQTMSFMVITMNLRFQEYLVLGILDFQVNSLQHLVGGVVQLQWLAQSGLFWNVVVSSFSLFFLKFDRDTSDWSFLDPLHGVGDETGDLVFQVLGWPDGDFINDSGVGVEIESEFGVVFFYDSSGSFLDGLGSYSSHVGLVF